MGLPSSNTAVLAILRSRAHRLLSGMAIELMYTGRRTGKDRSVPVQYARSGDRLIVAPQHPDRTTWWRNFQTPRPVSVRLAGRLRSATARVIASDHPEWEPARQVYVARWRRMAKNLSGPLVEITLHPDG